ncbi:FecR domain-containing protein [Sphingomonas sp. dw_22]|uniref:FecR family protein n=1 Tax=Sphingomonas sp. dw_22 TaxID=2721175 RepID=UPI001BD63269|nr:FecR domain-containing protein [Sphingomonas sp. dw_22]
MRRMLAAVAAIAVLASMPVSAQTVPATQSTDDVLYTVRQGDTLIGLAKRGFKRNIDYLAAQRLNKVANPRALRPGSVLRLPVRLLRTQPVGARIIAFRGAAMVNGAAARVGMAVAEGMELRTGADAFLALELADSSLLTLPSRSQIKVVDLHRVVLTGNVMKRFMLTGGRSETEAQPIRRGDSFEVRTPLSVSAVRGTRFRVSLVEGTEGASTSVLEGKVAVAGGTKSVAVPAGLGVLASTQGPGTPVPLLPRPTLRDPDRLQDEERVTFRMEPLQGAMRYRVQLSTDAGFVDTFAENDAATPEIGFAGVPNGSFFARATALSQEGIEGFPVVQSFERRQNNITAEAGEIDDCPVQRCLRFRWRVGGEGERRFRFQISASPDGVPIIDQTEMTGSEIVLTDLPGGIYYWRVESSLIEGGRRQSKWSDQQELRVAPASR